MKILSLHCDYIKFKPTKKAISFPEKLEKKEEINVKEPLVIFVSVEKQDESNPNIYELLTKEINDIANKVGSKKIVLYPYAHLSSSLSKPEFALEILKKTEQELKKQFPEVTRAPFGYYKEFELKCKGHPLAELSREIGYEKTHEEKESLKKISSEEIFDYKKLLKEISKSKLDTSKLKENDHRIIGKQMDLFSFSDLAPGMVFWHNDGLIIRNKLIEYMREEQDKEGYKEIQTPQIIDKRLWQISGHWEKYKENIFLTEYEGKTFAVKPMSCPGGILVYKNSKKSYRDLPLRVAEMGIVHRKELTGVVGGLFRVTQITQDDGHIFCTESQLENEIINIIELIKRVYSTFKIVIDHVELSTRPQNRIGSEEIWDKAEKNLESALKKSKLSYKINKGEGAFYGPKIDFHINDSLGRTWQCSTIQLDFSMPERFDLTYTTENNEEKRPVMIHRAIYGSVERFIGILLEKTNGRLPLWLAPKQIRIINFTDRNNEACIKLFSELKNMRFRVDLDLSSEPLNGKIKKAELLKIPYIITIGDKEEKDLTLAVRKKGKIYNIKKEELIEMLNKEVRNKEVT